MKVAKVLAVATLMLAMPLAGVASAKPTADLSVSMTASPQPVVINWNLTYEIVVRNHGPSAATRVKLLDEYGSDAYYVWVGTNDGSCAHTAGGEIRCSLGTLYSGGVAEVTVILTNGGGDGSGNTVTVSSSTADPKMSNNSVSMSVKTIAGQPPPSGGPSQSPSPSGHPSGSPSPSASATASVSASSSVTPEASPDVTTTSASVGWIVAIVVLAGAGLGGFLLWRRRH